MTSLLSRRSLLAQASASLALAALTVPRAARALEAGQALPLASVPGGAGQPAVPLFDGKARATYIDFWASWCGPCRQSFPWMNRMQARYGAKGLRIVAVNLDSQPADAQRFLAQLPAQFSLAFDAGAESARRFGIKAMPSSVLLGADGKVVATHAGFREEDASPLEARIAAALGAA
ncbi:TlpA disulfide reductase family protein [Ideonella sp.]|uniref:TlpA family protein disulfide reductase n=1 Tax=Ideonella sp. TaxID=1929293 RepID=UPI002B4666C7|nr:TlpA disulfide reductase family protein [Ideonella sp.]HJV71028.1 TlpA disulfide reductase family protein [Ideonella sp.]